MQVGLAHFAGLLQSRLTVIADEVKQSLLKALHGRQRGIASPLDTSQRLSSNRAHFVEFARRP